MADDPKELTVRETAVAEFSVDQVIAQLAKVQQLMKNAMVEGVDYGVVPGTKKPTLLKPGAEKLCLMFRLDPEYTSSQMFADGHLTVVSTCTLYHVGSGNRMGSGQGLCSTREAKYAYRTAVRVCPSCNAEAIKKGATKFGGGYYCDKKLGGCGFKYGDGDPLIEEQDVGRQDNPDIADTYNTVLKMANKRALAAAVLNVTGASQIFTQDTEDFGRKVKKERTDADTVNRDEIKEVTARARAVLGKDAGDKWLRANCAQTMTVGQFKEALAKLRDEYDHRQAEAPEDRVVGEEG